MTNLEQREASKLRKQLDLVEKNTILVFNKEYQQHMNQSVQQGWEDIERGDLRKAKSHLYEAERYFNRARYEGSVFFYYTKAGLIISLVYLAVFLSIAILATRITLTDTHKISLLVALSGGGIGGTTAVLSKILGIHLETQAITTRVTWYILKPLLGAIMGTVTYFAIISGMTILTNSMRVDNLPGVFLTGFLGGYLESFSTKILNELAESMGKKTNNQQIPHVETSEQDEKNEH